MHVSAASGAAPRPPEDDAGLVFVLVLASALLFVGWTAFYFLCDDAYIAFRYISNRRLGWGYVWNPPPFAPVEGYTSFLWIALLDLIWTWWGTPPTVSAPVVGLLCSQVTLLTLAAWVLRLPMSAAQQAWRPWWLALVLLGLLTNTSFLEWTSSGLEAPLVISLLTLWSFVAFAPRRGGAWAVLLSVLGSALALTRPDGLLFVAATLGVVALQRGLRGWRRWDAACAVGPAVVFAHMLWRHHTYGFWLPNTYYAKVAEPWPDMGLVYLQLFVLHHGLFLWLPLLVAWAWRGRAGWRRADLVAWGAVATLAAQVAYYVLRVGGDHFSFRVFAHLPGLLFVLALAAALRLTGRVWPVMVVMLGLLLGSGVISWADHVDNLAVNDASGIQTLRRPIAHKLPGVLGPWASRHDRLEDRAARHLVATPFQTHRWFARQYEKGMPKRDAILRKFPADHWVPGHTAKDAYPVVALNSVGVAGWNWPTVAVIDQLGLNDRVIARNPLKPGAKRYMAHSRKAPKGYVDCFRPNVRVRNRARVKDREVPLAWHEIEACEALYWQRVVQRELEGD